MTTFKERPQDIPFWGLDRRPQDRPGVPREHAPRPVPHAHWKEPVAQTSSGHEVLKRADLEELTPVYGTAQPPHGLSGAIRRLAYTFPDHRVRHWALLLFADRVDVIESSPTRLLALTLGGVATVTLLLAARRHRGS